MVSHQLTIDSLNTSTARFQTASTWTWITKIWLNYPLIIFSNNDSANFDCRLVQHDAGRRVPSDELRISELRSAGSHLRKALRRTGSWHLVTIRFSLEEINWPYYKWPINDWQNILPSLDWPEENRQKLLTKFVTFWSAN